MAQGGEHLSNSNILSHPIYTDCVERFEATDSKTIQRPRNYPGATAWLAPRRHHLASLFTVMTSAAPGQVTLDDTDPSFVYSGVDWAFDLNTANSASAYNQTLHCVQPDAVQPSLSFSYNGEHR